MNYPQGAGGNPQRYTGCLASLRGKRERAAGFYCRVPQIQRVGSRLVTKSVLVCLLEIRVLTPGGDGTDPGQIQRIGEHIYRESAK